MAGRTNKQCQSNFNLKQFKPTVTKVFKMWRISKTKQKTHHHPASLQNFSWHFQFRVK